MTIDELLKELEINLSIFKRENLLEHLKILELYNISDIFLWFSKKDERTLKLENLLFECYKYKLYIEEIDYNEIDNLEDIFCDTNGNIVFTNVLRYWRYMVMITDYLDNYGIVSKSRCLYLTYKNAINYSAKLRQTLNNLKLDDVILHKLSSLLLEIYNRQLEKAFEPLFDEAVKEKEISYLDFEKIFANYYSNKTSILMMNSVEYDVIIENISELILQNSKYSNDKNFKTLIDIINKFQQNNKNLTKKRLALFSNIQK